MASKLDSLADQGSLAIVNSNTVLHMHPLKFPTQFLSSNGGELKPEWRILCQTLAVQGKMMEVVNWTSLARSLKGSLDLLDWV